MWLVYSRTPEEKGNAGAETNALAATVGRSIPRSPLDDPYFEGVEFLRREYFRRRWNEIRSKTVFASQMTDLAIETDLKAARADRLSRDELLKRLAERFVYVVVKPGAVGSRVELVVVSALGEDGMFLPVFTSDDRFRATYLANGHESLCVAFDEAMRQIRPDTGVILNPTSDTEYTLRWFILQEYIDDFGKAFVKQEVTTEWLEEVNAGFTAREVAHGQRSWEAIRVWSEANGGLPVCAASPRAERIQAWFRENINPTSAQSGALATGAFFHDTSFWEVTIPVCYGRPTFNPLEMLRMPASVKRRFASDQNDPYVFLKFFADTYDYFYTVEDILPTLATKPFLAGFVGAGREQITQAAALLLGRNPNPKAAEAARFALEMFLKTYLIVNAGFGEKELKAFSHRMEALLDRCLAIDAKSELRQLELKLGLYPDVGARYRTDPIAPKALWAMYYAAQNAGATVLRPLSNRNTAATIKLGP
jgi:hypothetical protein